MTTEGFKYSIKFSQSVSSGVIAFSGEYNFDSPDEYTKNTNHLYLMLKDQEKIFKDNGYRVAFDIKPKEVKNKDGE